MTTPSPLALVHGRLLSLFTRSRIVPPGIARLDAPRETMLAVSLVLCAMVFWFLTRYYGGTRHDSMLYLAQAMHKAWPENFRNDIFFAFGSQDQFSIYSSFYVWLGSLFGWVQLMPVLLAFCQVAFIVAVVLLLRELIPLGFFAIGLVLAATVPYYGGYVIFSFGEPFLTARSFAEPLVLLALLCIYKGRLLASMPFLLAGFLFHPLMALVGVGVLYVWVAQDQPRWWWLTLLAPLALLLAAVDTPGFDVLLRTYDDEWWDALSHNAFVFPALWRGQDWAKVIFDATMLFLAARLLGGARAKLLMSILVVGAVTLLVSSFGADVFRLQLITQAQLWRSQWVAHLLACCMFPWVVWRLRDRGTLFWLGAVLSLASVEFRLQPSSGYIALMGALTMLYSWRRSMQTTRWFDGAVIIAALAIVFIGFANEISIVSYRDTISLETDPFRVMRNVFEYTMVALCVMLGCVMLALRAPRLVASGATLALVFVIVTWDQRSNWNRYVESGLEQEHPFAHKIPKSAQVYWAGELVPAWFMLKRASYYTANQASGLLFNRQTAIEYKRRQELVNTLEVQAGICRQISSLMSNCSPGMRELREVCLARNGPDFVVLQWDMNGAYIDQWRGQFTNETMRDYYLFSCSELNRRPISADEPN